LGNTTTAEAWLKIHNSGAGLFVDRIAELTAAAGVTIDGLLLKDGGATLAADLDLAGNDLLTTNLAFYEYNSTTFAVRNRAKTAEKHFQCYYLYSRGLVSTTTNMPISAKNAANTTINFNTLFGGAKMCAQLKSLGGGDGILDLISCGGGNLPVADPADGTNKLWNNGGVVTVGT